MVFYLPISSRFIMTTIICCYSYVSFSTGLAYYVGELAYEMAQLVSYEINFYIFCNNIFYEVSYSALYKALEQILTLPNSWHSSDSLGLGLKYIKEKLHEKIQIIA